MQYEIGLLAQALKIDLKDHHLLLQAMVHSSYLNEYPDTSLKSNERLEFLGDAVLGLVIGQVLFLQNPDAAEGDLTWGRSAIVQARPLADAARTLQLGKFLLLGRGEDAAGGRNRESNLAAAYEAVVGAIFLDQGYDAARLWIITNLADRIAALGTRETIKSPKSVLQEVVQSHGHGPPSYRTVAVSGPDHERTFTAEVIVAGEVVGRGQGKRKVVAEQEAARQALERFTDGPRR